MSSEPMANPILEASRPVDENRSHVSEIEALRATLRRQQEGLSMVHRNVEEMLRELLEDGFLGDEAFDTLDRYGYAHLVSKSFHVTVEMTIEDVPMNCWAEMEPYNISDWLRNAFVANEPCIVDDGGVELSRHDPVVSVEEI